MKRSAKAKEKGKEKIGPWELFSMSQGSLNELGRRLVPSVTSPVVHRVILWRRPGAVVLCRSCLPAVAAPEGRWWRSVFGRHRVSRGCGTGWRPVGTAGGCTSCWRRCEG